MQNVGFLNVKCSTTLIFRSLLLRCWGSLKGLFDVNSTADGKYR